jgi:hypothetical protein
MARKAMTGKAGARKESSPTRKGGLWGVVLLIPMVAMATALPLCVLFAAGMLPSAVAALVDRNPRRYLTGTVAILNLAGMVIPVLALFKAGLRIDGTWQVLADGRNWIIMYGAAGIGWVLDSAMPSIGRVIVDYRVEREERRLARRAEQLIAEWGNDITGG